MGSCRCGWFGRLTLFDEVEEGRADMEQPSVWVELLSKENAQLLLIGWAVYRLERFTVQISQIRWRLGRLEKKVGIEDAGS